MILQHSVISLICLHVTCLSHLHAVVLIMILQLCRFQPDDDDEDDDVKRHIVDPVPAKLNVKSHESVLTIFAMQCCLFIG